MAGSGCALLALQPRVQRLTQRCRMSRSSCCVQTSTAPWMVLQTQAWRQSFGGPRPACRCPIPVAQALCNPQCTPPVGLFLHWVHQMAPLSHCAMPGWEPGTTDASKQTPQGYCACWQTAQGTALKPLPQLFAPV